MIVVIPSRGRAGNVQTLKFLPPEQNVVVVVPRAEFHDYVVGHGGSSRIVVQCADDWPHIGAKRQWIMDRWGHDKVIMLDDDLRFRKRYASDEGFVTASTKDIGHMLRMLSITLDNTPHAGIADEFMCQHQPRGHRIGGRYNQVLAYNFALLRGRGEAPRFRLAVNEEHDVHLQLARMGHLPIVLTDWTKGSKYNASGGCSTWRTAEFEKEQFYEFQRLWPDLVTVVPNKGSLSGLGTRVKWSRACPR